MSARSLRRQAQFQSDYDAGVANWDGPDRLGAHFNGSQPIDASGSGFELRDMAMSFQQDLRSQDRKSKGPRNFRNRTEIRTRLFEAQMEGMLKAYLHWAMLDDLKWEGVQKESEPKVGEGSYHVRVIDVFGEHVGRQLHLKSQ